MSEIKVLDNGNVKVIIPISMRSCGGRRKIVTPERPDETTENLKVLLARAFRWQEMIDSGAYENAEALALDANVDPALVRRTCRLTLLAPGLVREVLSNRRLAGFNGDLRMALPDSWEVQRKLFGTME